MIKIISPNTKITFKHKQKNYDFSMFFSHCVDYEDLKYLHEIIALECLKHAIKNYRLVSKNRKIHIEDLALYDIGADKGEVELYKKKDCYVYFNFF